MTIHSEDIRKEETILERRVEAIEARTFDIQFSHEGKTYKGWVTPSGEKGEDGNPKSFHVVLNDVFFGNLHIHDDIWEADSQREQSLVQATGKQIDNYLTNLQSPVI